MKKLYLPALAVALIIFLCAALLLIDDMTTARRGAIFVSLFGPVGALWALRLIIVSMIAGVVWVVWSDVKMSRKIDRVLFQRHIVDQSVRRNTLDGD